MMYFSCMKAVYGYTRYPGLATSIVEKNYRYLTRKPATRKKNTLKNYHRSDPIRCAAVMKLARCLRI